METIKSNEARMTLNVGCIFSANFKLNYGYILPSFSYLIFKKYKMREMLREKVLSWLSENKNGTHIKPTKELHLFCISLFHYCFLMSLSNPG